jgi:histidinol-phosphate aminotransferase
MAVGGRGTNFVYADPSFVLYSMCALLTGTESVAVPVTANHDHDLKAMVAAVTDETGAMFVCNPNNPTGNHLSSESVSQLLNEIPDRVLVVIDEAYAEYVTADDYSSMLGQAPDQSNLLVLRTFSKVYGLAGLRVGYAVGNPDLLAALKRTQGPFAITSVGQAAALEALKHQTQVRERAAVNADGRGVLFDALAARGYAPAPTQANFVYFEPEEDPRALADGLMREGTIVRVLGKGVRVTVGTEAENARFIGALDAVRNR